jgi:hypothetical protein
VLPYLSDIEVGFKPLDHFDNYFLQQFILEISFCKRTILANYSFHSGADYSLHTRPYKVSGSTQKLQKRLKPGAQVGTENMRKASIHQQPQEEETPGLVHVSLSIQIWS